MKRAIYITISLMMAAVAFNTKAFAHHNANYPDSVNPAFTGIELYSYHNDAIAAMQERRDSVGENVENTETTMHGVSTQTSSASSVRSGDTIRSVNRKH